MSLIGWLAGLATALGLAVITGLISEETRARLDRIPYALLLLAISRLPAEIRPDVGEEWHAELDHILHRVEAYPLTRLLYGIRFSIGLLRAAPRIGNDLISMRAITPAEEPPPRRSHPRRSHPRISAAPSRLAEALRTRGRRPAAVFAIALTMTVAVSWRLGVTTAIIITGVMVAGRWRTGAASPLRARARTRQRLSRLRRNRYICLHARAVPGTGEIIDHLVIGPAGIYALGSQWWDPRLTARAKSAGGQLFHGPVSQAALLEDTQRGATDAAALIGAEARTHVSVRPGLVVYGSRLFRDVAPLRGVARLRGVDVFGPRATRTWLQRDPATLSEADVKRLAAAAARALPPSSQAADPRLTGKLITTEDIPADTTLPADSR